jgi:hypothetical protein
VAPAWAVSILRTIGVNGILGGVARALTPTPKRPIQSVKVTATGGTNALPVIFGTRRVGGQLAYLGTSGTNNSYLHYVIAHTLTSPCGIDDITDIYIDGTTIPDANINGSGIVTTGTHAGWAEVRRVLGTDSDAVDSVLDTAFSEIDSTFTGKGIAKTYFRFYRDTANDKGFQEVFPRGNPVVSVLLKGQKCYDPRLDSTNGGSGSARYSDSDTWTYSANPAVCLATFAIMAKMDGGCGMVAASEVNWPSVAAAANICDESRTIPDGLGGSTTQVRYECHAVLSTSDDLTGNLDKLAGSMSGQWVITGGVLHVYAGAYTSPVATVDESYLSGHPTYTPRMPIESLWNAVKGSFDNAAAAYRTEFAAPYTNATYETQDDGQRLWRTEQFFCTTNQYQAQYLQTILGRRSRQQAQLALPMNLRSRDLRVWDTVTVTLDELDISQVFRIVDMDHQPDGAMVTLIEESSTVYESSLSSFDETVAPTTPSITEETPPTPTGVSVTGTTLGNVLNWTVPPVDVVVEIHASDTSGGTFTNVGEIQGSSFTDSVSGGTTRYYKIRFRIRNTAGSFSSEVSATAIAVATIPDWAASGTADSDTDDGAGGFAITPSYPAGCVAGDLLWIQVGAQAGGTLDAVTHAAISGWTAFAPVASASGRESHTLYWKRASGGETGTVTVTGSFDKTGSPTTNASNVVIAQIHRFTSVVGSGTPYEGNSGTANAASTTVPAENITTTTNNCLACQFVFVAEDESLVSFTGESGVDYVEVAESSTTAGGDIAIQLQVGDKATAGAITGGTMTIGTSQISIVYGFGLKPA